MNKKESRQRKTLPLLSFTTSFYTGQVITADLKGLQSELRFKVDVNAFFAHEFVFAIK